jgi:hypothetical protein
VGSSTRRLARSLSFEDDVDCEKEEVKEAEAAQWVLGPEDFIADDDEAEWRAFELVRRLSEVEAEAARQRAALEACVDIALVREYEQWQRRRPLAASRRRSSTSMTSRPPLSPPSAMPVDSAEFILGPNFGEKSAW